MSDSTKKGMVSSSWNAFTSVRRLPTAVSPLSARPGRPKALGEQVAERLDGLLELGEDQHLLLPAGDCGGDLGKARKLAAVLSRPRAPPPRPCCAWLQICFRRISVASTSPRRPMSSPDSSSRSSKADTVVGKAPPVCG